MRLGLTINHPLQLLKALKLKNEFIYFRCKREYSDYHYAFRQGKRSY